MLGLFHRLVPPQNAPPLVDHDGTSRAVGMQAAPQGLAAPIRPAIGVEGIGLQVVERLNGCLARPPVEGRLAGVIVSLRPARVPASRRWAAGPS